MIFSLLRSNISLRLLSFISSRSELPRDWRDQRSVRVVWEKIKDHSPLSLKDSNHSTAFPFQSSLSIVPCRAIQLSTIPQSIVRFRRSSERDRRYEKQWQVKKRKNMFTLVISSCISLLSFSNEFIRPSNSIVEVARFIFLSRFNSALSNLSFSSSMVDSSLWNKLKISCRSINYSTFLSILINSRSSNWSFILWWSFSYFSSLSN